LLIHELIIGTIQGEGSNTGLAVDFVRLHGCNVGCWFCDTGYAKADQHGANIISQDLTFEEISSQLKSINVVISGGEPMLCSELPEFCEYLIKRGRRIFVETSGTAWKELPPEVWITLSPKDNVSKLKTKQIAWDNADEIKFVVDCNRPREDLTEYYIEKINSNPIPLIYLQPEESSFNGKNVSNILDLLQQIPDAKLSLQTHKILNIA